MQHNSLKVNSTQAETRFLEVKEKINLYFPKILKLLSYYVVEYLT
jgi:hypothetical protein